MLLAPLPTRLRSIMAPGDRGWDDARSAFNLLLDQQPAAIAFPADAGEVAAAVGRARARGLRIAPQSTAHNQGPLGSLENTMLLNVSRLRELHVDLGAQRVRVGAGVRWERVVPRLSAHGLAALHGSSPRVGIAGYSLGGGIGWLARAYGLQANAVTALEVFTADGELVHADADHHPDLFWALRGGSGNFGVVTAIEFDVHAVDDLYAGTMFFPFERSAEVLRTWSALLPSLPDEMTSWASVIHFPPTPDVPAFARGRSFAVVMAAFLGNQADGRDLLWPLRDLRPVRDTFAMVPPIVLADLAMDPLDPLPYHLTHQLLEALPADAIDELMANVGPGSGRGPTVTMLQFRHLGGALARATPGAGARATLPGEICMMALGAVLDEAGDVAVRTALADIDAAVARHRAGHYPNFVEAPADASGFFDPAIWARLREVKALYDPADRFIGNHHIPPAECR